MVKRNIFTLILLFMYFINAISYPSDGINVIPCQLFPKILNVCIHNRATQHPKADSWLVHALCSKGTLAKVQTLSG